MSVLIFVIIVLVLAGLALYGVRSIPIPTPFNWIAQVLIVIVAFLVIAQKAGLL